MIDTERKDKSVSFSIGRERCGGGDGRTQMHPTPTPVEEDPEKRSENDWQHLDEDRIKEYQSVSKYSWTLDLRVASRSEGTARDAPRRLQSCSLLRA